MRVLSFFVSSLLAAGCTLRGTDYLQEGLGGAGGPSTGGAGGAGGSGGTGGVPCEVPEADCDADGSCETDLSEASESCGACGYACPGLCRDGSCRIAEVDTSIGLHIALDDVHAYFTDWMNRVLRVRLDGLSSGGAPLTEEFDLLTFSPTDIHVDGTHVYWTANELPNVAAGVWRKPKDNPTATREEVFRYGGTEMSQVAGTVGGDTQKLVFSYSAAPTTSDPAFGDIMLKLKNDIGAAPLVLVPGEPPALSIASTVDDVLWLVPGGGDSATGALRHWSLSGVETIASGLANPAELALDGSTVAFVVSLGVADDPGGRVERMSWSPPGRPELLLEGLEEPYFVAVDAAHVYVAEASLNGRGAGAIKRVPKEGGAVETLARAARDKDIFADLALTGDSVVWLAEGPAGTLAAPVEVWRRSKAAYALP